MEHPERSGKLWDYLKIVEYRLYTPKETLARARSRIGESNYNLFSNNCEHFALWCKTGISESHQISGLLDTLMMTDYKGHVIKMSSDMANEKYRNLRKIPCRASVRDFSIFICRVPIKATLPVKRQSVYQQ